MKKALSLILALVLCLSLCACGAKESGINTTNLLGSWQCTYPSEIDAITLGVGDIITETIELYEAGIAKVLRTNTTKGEDLAGFPATWEIYDDCYIRVKYTTSTEITLAYKVNVVDSVYTLTQIDKPDRVLSKIK